MPNIYKIRQWFIYWLCGKLTLVQIESYFEKKANQKLFFKVLAFHFYANSRFSSIKSL